MISTAGKGGSCRRERSGPAGTWFGPECPWFRPDPPLDQARDPPLDQARDPPLDQACDSPAVIVGSGPQATSGRTVTAVRFEPRAD